MDEHILYELLSGVSTAALWAKPGVHSFAQHALLLGTHLAAMVDIQTGCLVGLWEKRHNQRLINQTVIDPVTKIGTDICTDFCTKETWKPDLMKVDLRPKTFIDVTHKARRKGYVSLAFTHPDLPGLTITKSYYFAVVAGEERILCCGIEITAGKDQVPETMLLRLSSQTIFGSAFPAADSFYDRLFVSGCNVPRPGSPDWQQQIPLEAIKPGEPMPQWGVPNPDKPDNMWWQDVLGAQGRAQFSVVNPNLNRGLGLAQYLYKVDGRWAYPTGITQTYLQAYLDDGGTHYGWEMGSAGDFFKVGETKTLSCEMRYHVFYGDRLAFHREYLDLPEHKAVSIGWQPAPDLERLAVPSIIPSPLLNAQDCINHPSMLLREEHLREGEFSIGMVGPCENRCGIYPASPSESVAEIDHSSTSDPHSLTNQHPCSEVRSAIVDLHAALSTRRVGIRIGRYRWIADIWNANPQNQAPICTDHSDWIVERKDGTRLRSAFLCTDCYVFANCHHDFLYEHLLPGLLKEVDYFDLDMLYLDFLGGVWFVDWGTEQVVKPYMIEDWLKKLHDDLAQRGVLLFINSVVDQPGFDIGYHETWPDDEYVSWRSSGNIWLMRKLYTRPGTMCMPTPWNTDLCNDERYRNLTLASGLHAATLGYDKDDIKIHPVAYWEKYQFPTIVTSQELFPSQSVEIGLEPAWWRDLDSNDYEAYTLKQGASYLLNVISHVPASPKPARFTVDPELMRFCPGKPIFFWQFYAKTQAELQDVPVSGWDRMFKKREPTVYGWRPPQAAWQADFFEFELCNLEPEIVRMTCLTQVPAFVYSVGRNAAGSFVRTQLLLTDNLCCHVRGGIDRENELVRLDIVTEQEAQILCFWPFTATARDPKIQPGGYVTKTCWPSDEPLPKIDDRWRLLYVPKGTWKIKLTR